MNVKQPGHAAFRCADLEASEAFYKKAFGLEQKFYLTYGDWIEGMKKQDPAPTDLINALMPLYDKVWISYLAVGEDFFLELFDKGDADTFCVPSDRTFNFQHLALITEDIHALRDELTEKGVEIDIQPSLGPDHTWQMWMHDPDGNKIEVMQYTERSFQLVGRN